MKRNQQKTNSTTKIGGDGMKKSILIYILFIVIITVTIVSIFRTSININQSEIATLKKQVKIYQLQNKKLQNVIEEIRIKVNSVIMLEKAQDDLLEKAEQ